MHKMTIFSLISVCERGILVDVAAAAMMFESLVKPHYINTFGYIAKLVEECTA